MITITTIQEFNSRLCRNRTETKHDYYFARGLPVIVASHIMSVIDINKVKMPKEDEYFRIVDSKELGLIDVEIQADLNSDFKRSYIKH